MVGILVDDHLLDGVVVVPPRNLVRPRPVQWHLPARNDTSSQGNEELSASAGQEQHLINFWRMLVVFNAVQLEFHGLPRFGVFRIPVVMQLGGVYCTCLEVFC